MVLINETVQNVLNRIYLVGIAYNGKPPKMYFDCKEAIENLDKTIANIFAQSVQNAPFAWKRDNILVCKVGKYCFSYNKSYIGNEIIISVEEVAENGIIITENKNNSIMKNTKNRIRLTESQLHKIIKKVIKEGMNGRVKTANVNGAEIHYVEGKSIEEWEQLYGGYDSENTSFGLNDEPLWDFPLEELMDGSVEVNEDIIYWLINGRMYETNETI